VCKDANQTFTMANEEQLQLIRSGVPEWNAWRRENTEKQIDLSGAT
jgi:hypothetical protein